MISVLAKFKILLSAGFVLTLFWGSQSYALSQISVEVAEVKGLQWQLKNARLAMVNLRDTAASVELKIASLVLPKPLEQLQLLNVRCPQFEWHLHHLECKDGQAIVKLNGLKLLPVKLAFKITDQGSQLQLTDLKLSKGIAGVKVTERNGQWRAVFDAHDLAIAPLQSLFKLKQVGVKTGELAATLVLEGEQTTVKQSGLMLKLANATGQNTDGRFAIEKANLEGYVTLQLLPETWTIQSHWAFNKGGLYVDPVFLKAEGQSIELDGVGEWSPVTQQWQVDYFQYIHPKMATLNGSVRLDLARKKSVKNAQLNLKASDLKALTTVYNAPFWVGSAFEAVTLSGQLEAKLSIVDQALAAMTVQFEQVGLHDPKSRFGLKGAKGHFNWENRSDFKRQASLDWEALNVYALPIGPAKLQFEVGQNGVELYKPVVIGLLGGEFDINAFTWQVRRGQEPELHFSGGLREASLEQLSAALNWTPLSGSISGDLPGVKYQHNRLDLEGELKVRLFDGMVSIQKLAVANLLSDLPKFYGDINIDRLNLNQLTSKFKFGSIDGLLSGFVHDLYLEDWQPISFYAWLGTPENDRTEHRISQKAVDNIANIGGNGATDLVSRGVLHFFDSFGYDRLGLGCYLHDGVCQLIGVEASKQGYTIVKGGGLPRIDVLGFNPRVDWSVLLQRLERVGKPNEVVVQ